MIFKDKMKKFHPGFTLVEILVVLAIIGIIVGIATISVSTIRQKSRDIKRLKEVDSVRTALQMYFYNEGQYPNSITFGSTLTGSSSSSTYMALLPTNPSPRNDGICPDNDYAYYTTATSTNYKLDFCLSTPVGNVSSGQKCATPQGILNQSCFVCGESLTYSGESYPTVLINDQCWLAKNLNVGTKINSGSSEPACHDVSSGSGHWSCQVDPATVEKYCYNDDASSECATYGSLYEWAEAMGFPYQCNNADFSSGSSNCGTANTYTVANEHQGICPSGWHIANYADMAILDNYLGGLEVAGGKIKEAGTTHWSSPNTGADNSSNFTGLPGGYRNYNGAYFSLQYNGIFLISTKPANTINSGIVDLAFNATTAAEYDIYRVAGHSIRCVKN